MTDSRLKKIATIRDQVVISYWQVIRRSEAVSGRPYGYKIYSNEAFHKDESCIKHQPSLRWSSIAPTGSVIRAPRLFVRQL